MSYSLDYSIIIPAYNEEKLLPGTLEQIIESMSMVGAEKGEIIVVDNNSTDGTAKVAKAKNCKVVHEPFRQIAKARNTGASFARGKYLLFIDADTLIPGPTLIEALRTMQQDGVGGGGSILSFDKTHGRFWSGKVLPALWNFISKHFSLFAGSFVFCRADLFFKSKGFPETHFAGEEIIFNKRLKNTCREEGLKIAILQGFPVCSSARKLEWHNDWSILTKVLPLVGLPWLLKSRKSCQFWYERPKS